MVIMLTCHFCEHNNGCVQICSVSIQHTAILSDSVVHIQYSVKRQLLYYIAIKRTVQHSQINNLKVDSCALNIT